VLAFRMESLRRRESRVSHAESCRKESRAGEEVSCRMAGVSGMRAEVSRASVSIPFFDESTAWAKESGEGGLTGGWAIAVRQTAQHITTSISSLLINNRGISLKMLKSRIYCIK
jgi:hypothetical protein